MGKITGFKEFGREVPLSRDPQERINDFHEIYLDFSPNKTKQQAARCMDCGVPFCQSGCPLGNHIPDFNDAVYRQDWKMAYEILSKTNNFPEFTGRICPAPCEASCVLGINQSPVSIEHIEKTVIEEAFVRGYVKPIIPAERTGKKVAVVGSGPAGLAAAAELNRSGHWVTIFERDDQAGGLLRYGIPDFKLDKSVVERRVDLMKKEGITFQVNTHIGVNFSISTLKKNFDAIVLCGGATVPRAAGIPGSDLKGVHFAMDFLTTQNKQVAGLEEEVRISAKSKKVVVIGGGDTGADCVGTSNRQGATSVHQLELMDKPPLTRSADNPWPNWPVTLRTSSSHEEGATRDWGILTKEFMGDDEGNLIGLKTVRVSWEKNTLGTSKMVMTETPGSEQIMPCDIALIAIGFLHPEKDGIIGQLGLTLDSRGNVATENYQTSEPGIFAAGDMRRGQSLVVWAIAEGRKAADSVNFRFLS